MKPGVKLPIGIENFEKLRTEGFYYVDKTGLITELLNSWSEVNLFTRPRRFGKSLNMNMLKRFFSYGCDPQLFDGLAVSEEAELCEKYMGKFPVISITLKGVEGMDFEEAVSMLRVVIGQEALRFDFLSKSEMLSDTDKEQYARITRVGSPPEPMFPMERNVLTGSLKTLSDLLYKHYDQKVVLLIDEYDVPLDKANQYGYYDEMVHLIRGLFGNALKTNENLFLAVLTGCLRVAKESIFTGLNNFKVRSITDTRFDAAFGFTDADPEAFWINSSGNAIIRTLLQKATNQTMEDLDQLVNGLSVTKKISEELTYRELYDSIDNLWSVLFTTGYLTKRQKTAPATYELVIPNQEIRVIFTEQILSWFQEEVRKDAPTLDAFCEAFSAGDPSKIGQLFSSYLKRTISIRDTAVQKDKKESFYHGILLGLLSHRQDWSLRSNAESGKGYSDILIKIKSISMGIVIEIKYSESRNLEATCQKALNQIEEKNYAEQLIEDDMTTILKYGIACRRTACMVKMAD